jgi:amidase
MTPGDDVRPAGTDMRRDDVWALTAREMAVAVRTRALSSREVTQACLARTEHLNPRLGALVELDPTAALAAADEADAAVTEGRALGPLHGVPTATKINTDHAGHATSQGVAAFATAPVDEDSPPVRNLRQAGHVFVGRTNCPAFASRWFTDSAPYGLTRNPWDETRTPGGSSGGASSAVASGMLPIAYGNDIGGSVRYPAYACGLAGLRPTVGRIPNFARVSETEPFPTLANQVMFVQGPIARRVDDLRLGLLALSGPDLRDGFSMPLDPVETEPRRIARPRVALMRGGEVAEPAPAVTGGLLQAAQSLEDAGYAVEEVELDTLIEAWRLWWLLFLEEVRPSLPLVEQVGDDGFKAALADYYEVWRETWGPTPSLADYIAGYSRRGALISLVQQALEEHPLVLLPVSAEVPFLQGSDTKGTARVKELIAAQWSMMAIACLGLPAIAVPTGVTDGLPMGVQLLGGRFQEALLLEAAEVIEAQAGQLTPITPAF